MNNRIIGFTFFDGFTIALFMLKYMGYIDCSWFFVWLPELVEVFVRVLLKRMDD